MEITQNNYGYDITFNVKNPKTGAPEPLTGTVKLQVVDSDTFRNVVNGDCEITDGTNGVCKYTVKQGDFARAGNFKASLQIQYTPSKNVNTKPFFLTVNRKFES